MASTSQQQQQEGGDNSHRVFACLGTIIHFDSVPIYTELPVVPPRPARPAKSRRQLLDEGDSEALVSKMKVDRANAAEANKNSNWTAMNSKSRNGDGKPLHWIKYEKNPLCRLYFCLGECHSKELRALGIPCYHSSAPTLSAPSYVLIRKAFLRHSTSGATKSATFMEEYQKGYNTFLEGNPTEYEIEQYHSERPQCECTNPLCITPISERKNRHEHLYGSREDQPGCLTTHKAWRDIFDGYFEAAGIVPPDSEWWKSATLLERQALRVNLWNALLEGDEDSKYEMVINNANETVSKPKPKVKKPKPALPVPQEVVKFRDSIARFQHPQASSSTSSGAPATKRSLEAVVPSPKKKKAKTAKASALAEAGTSVNASSLFAPGASTAEKFASWRYNGPPA